MAQLTLLTVAVLAVSVSAEFLTPPARYSSATTVDSWPSIVQVEIRQQSYYWVHACAANILRASFVLSVAQCFSGSQYAPANRRIRAGSSFSEYGGRTHYVTREYNHPSYGTRYMDGDISVVRLTTPLIFSPVIRQGIFIAQGIVIPDDLAVWHVGWSHIILPQRVNSGVLLETPVYTINRALCAGRYSSTHPGMVVTDNMICAAPSDSNEDSLLICDGDPGSPLYFEDPTQGDIIIGLASFGAGCSNYTFPGVHTAVSSYTNWIIATAV